MNIFRALQKTAAVRQLGREARNGISLARILLSLYDSDRGFKISPKELVKGPQKSPWYKKTNPTSSRRGLSVFRQGL